MRLTGHSKEVFRGWRLAEELGIERYRAAVGRLWQQLAWYEFDEAVPPLGYRSGLDHAPGEPRVRRRVVARYFPGRAELTRILREFTAGLFGAAAEAAGRRTWCEKTPFNLLSVPPARPGSGRQSAWLEGWASRAFLVCAVGVCPGKGDEMIEPLGHVGQERGCYNGRELRHQVEEAGQVRHVDAVDVAVVEAAGQEPLPAVLVLVDLDDREPGRPNCSAWLKPARSSAASTSPPSVASETYGPGVRLHSPSSYCQTMSSSPSVGPSLVITEFPSLAAGGEELHNSVMTGSVYRFRRSCGPGQCLVRGTGGPELR